jgi:penicillin-binding protein 1A
LTMVGGGLRVEPVQPSDAGLRQPGSAFKPFVYAAALDAGYSPSSLVTNLDEPIQTLQGEWMPEDEHSTESAMTVRTALRTSSNRAAVRMLEEIGVTRAVAQARKMGMGNARRTVAGAGPAVTR